MGNEAKVFWKDKEISLFPEGAAEIDNNLVLADLHLGYEGVAASSGLFVPKVMLKEAMEKIKRLKKRKNFEKLIICGDLKHEFSELHPAEWKDIQKFLEFLKDNFEKIIVVRGNHDNFLKILLKKENIDYFEDCFCENDIVYLHGDKIPEGLDLKSENKLVVMGHEHPAMMIRDSLGVSFKTPCFLFGQDVLVLPAFSSIFSGADIISMPKNAYLSPLLRKKDVDKMKVFVCLDDEILEFPELGKIKEFSLKDDFEL